MMERLEETSGFFVLHCCWKSLHLLQIVLNPARGENRRSSRASLFVMVHKIHHCGDYRWLSVMLCLDAFLDVEHLPRKTGPALKNLHSIGDEKTDFGLRVWTAARLVTTMVSRVDEASLRLAALAPQTIGRRKKMQ